MKMKSKARSFNFILEELGPAFVILTNYDQFYIYTERELFDLIDDMEFIFEDDEEIIFIGTYYEASEWTVDDVGIEETNAEVSYETLGIKI